MNQPHLSKRQLQKLIWLTGSRGPGYMVMVSGFDGMLPIAAPSVLTGHAIVKALRKLAAERPDHFPPSKIAALHTKPCVWCKTPVPGGEEGDIVDGEIFCRACAKKEN